MRCRKTPENHGAKPESSGRKTMRCKKTPENPEAKNGSEGPFALVRGLREFRDFEILSLWDRKKLLFELLA